VSRIDSVTSKIKRDLNVVKNACGSSQAPFNVSVAEEDVLFLFAELDSQRANISALQKKLNGCRNLHKQKDDMIARRDRSIAKAHKYIEQLKADVKAEKAKLRAGGCDGVS
jgi:hypothetical protein